MSQTNDNYAIDSLKDIKESQINQPAIPKTNSTLAMLLLEQQQQSQQGIAQGGQIWNKLQNNNNPLKVKYNIYWSNQEEQGRMYEIKVELPGDLKVEDCMLISIKELNKLLQNKGQLLTLPNDLNLYELHFAKKSGQPKDDYPALDPSQILSQTKVLSLCLVYQKQEIQQEQKPRLMSYEKSLNDFKRNTSASSQDEILPQGSCCFCFSMRRKKKVIK